MAPSRQPGTPNNEAAASMLEDFGIGAATSLETVSEGRIASNFVAVNEAGGRYILRVYDLGSGEELGYGMKRIEFEARVLGFLQGRSPVPTPELIPPADGSGTAYLERGQRIAMLYRMIEGESLKQSQLTVETSRKAGEGLRSLINALEGFESGPDAPAGGIAHIADTTDGLRSREPALFKDGRLSEMHRFVSDFPMAEELGRSPKGVVHGDFFFENTLWDSSRNLVGVIDFGDSFHGEIIHDIAIGAMEFSIGEDEQIDSDAFDAFLSAFSSWLKETETSLELFRAVLLANCVRFSSYLIALGLAAGEPLRRLTAAEYNPYIDRFEYFSQPDSLSGVSEHFSARMPRQFS